MVGEGDGEIENCKAASDQDRAKRFVVVAEPVRHHDENGATQEPDGNPTCRTDPVIVDRVFDEETDGQNKDGNPDLADQVLTDKFLPIRRFAWRGDTWRGDPWRGFLWRGVPWRRPRSGRRALHWPGRRPKRLHLLRRRRRR